MKKFWQIVYCFWVNPGIIIAAHLLALFLRRVRIGLLPRYTTIKHLQNWIDKNDLHGKRILFHTASLGEFEHIRPLLLALKESFQTINFVTFFSPSGYENVDGTIGLDYYFYLPFDRPVNWRRIYSQINPSLVIIAKHDVWPAQVWTAREEGVPIFLINASLGAKSSRTKYGVKSFLKHVYRDFETIYAISKEDGDRFSEHYPRCRVIVVGDTKYDQVVLRKKMAQSQDLLPEDWVGDNWIFVMGSIWPEDEAHLFPAVEKLLNELSQIRLVMVPHQPEDKTIVRIEEKFAAWGVKKFSQRESLDRERILIVDAIGYLAGLYSHAQLAYVGGSFQQGIHNAMEPAVFGIPVLYGPEYENSYEAIQLSKKNGGIVVKNARDIYHQVLHFYQNEKSRQTLGQSAEIFATRNTGATQKLLNQWQGLLDI
jgi:3-deoxy-D-manno-octulosonic-acid transferase